MTPQVLDVGTEERAKLGVNSHGQPNVTAVPDAVTISMEPSLPTVS